MRKTLLRLTGLCALTMLLAGSIAAQSLPSEPSDGLTSTGLNPLEGRLLTHSVLSEFGSPTG